MTIGTNVVRLRIAKGFSTQRAFAERVGVPQPRLSDIENDRYGTVTLETLFAFAKVLECSVDDLIQGTDPEYDLICHRVDVESKERKESSSESGTVESDLTAPRGIKSGQTPPTDQPFFPIEGTHATDFRPSSGDSSVSEARLLVGQLKELVDSVRQTATVVGQTAGDLYLYARGFEERIGSIGFAPPDVQAATHRTVATPQPGHVRKHAGQRPKKGGRKR